MLKETSIAVPHAPAQTHYADDRTPRRIGLVIVLLVFGVFGLWATLAPLSGAVLAAGQVTVESYRKTVQHLEGGIVKSIAVQENDRVTQGQLLLTMDDTQARAQLEVLRGQLFIALAREARLLAQGDGAVRVSYPPALLDAQGDPRAMDAMRVQDQTHRVRRVALEGEASLYARQIGQLQAKLRGLRAQKQGSERLTESFGREVQDFESLLKDGYTEIQKVRELQRNLASSEAHQGELVASIAATDLQISETEIKVLQLRKELQRDVAKELGEVQQELFGIKEKLQSVQDTVRRAEVRAPQPGRVLGLAVHTEGAVLPPGGRLMDIVPQDERLVLEAQVSPVDIDRIRAGQLAEVKFAAFKDRTLPRIEGRVLGVSADRLTEDNKGERLSYFLARVEVLDKGLATLAEHRLALVPGMPADVHIETGERTLLQYLVRPLQDSFSRGMKED
jgi:epimerase transport system membrane fusion protein